MNKSILINLLKNKKEVPISSEKTDNMRDNFWENIPIDSLNASEWEALCDGCGLCCLNKLEDIDTNKVYLTRVACKLLDLSTCQCCQYQTRHRYVPDCLKLDLALIKEINWLPSSCAYYLRLHNQPLKPWHYLISGDRELVHQLGISMKDKMISETKLKKKQSLEDFIIYDGDTG